MLQPLMRAANATFYAELPVSATIAHQNRFLRWEIGQPKARLRLIAELSGDTRVAGARTDRSP